MIKTTTNPNYVIKDRCKVIRPGIEVDEISIIYITAILSKPDNRDDIDNRLLSINRFCVAFKKSRSQSCTNDIQYQ